MPPVGKAEAERLLKIWLKESAEAAGYTVQGMPTLDPLAGGQSGFGHLAVNYLATITIVMDSNIAAEITEQMRHIPVAKDAVRVESRSEDLVKLQFRLGVEA